MRCKLFVRLVFGVLLSCVAVLAQLDTGSVLGTVFDSSRAVVASARVAIENQGTGFAVEDEVAGHAKVNDEAGQRFAFDQFDDDVLAVAVDAGDR